MLKTELKHNRQRRGAPIAACRSCGTLMPLVPVEYDAVCIDCFYEHPVFLAADKLLSSGKWDNTVLNSLDYDVLSRRVKRCFRLGLYPKRLRFRRK